MSYRIPGLSINRYTETASDCGRDCHELGMHNKCRNCDFIKCLSAGCDEDVANLRDDDEGPFCLLCQEQQAREEAALNAIHAAQNVAAVHAAYYNALAENARNANHPAYAVEGWEMLAAKYASSAEGVTA